MFITFGIEKLDNNRVRIHTVAFGNSKERKKKLRSIDAKLGRLMHIGVATKKQKRIFNDYENWAEEKLEA